MKEVKKKFVFVVAVIAMAAMVSCKDKIQTTKGVVKKTNDSALVVSIGKYDIVFSTKQARKDNEIIMKGDSVLIHYVGDLREKKARALLLHLLPRKGTVVDAVYDPSKELIVSEKPMPEKR